MDGNRWKHEYQNNRQGKSIDYNRPLAHGNLRRLLPKNYFSLESMLLLICLTASLLILPLILPPLPPPPFLLLLLPIGILVVLMFLAFMPTNAKDITYAWKMKYIALLGVEEQRPLEEGPQNSIHSIISRPK